MRVRAAQAFSIMGSLFVFIIFIILAIGAFSKRDGTPGSMIKCCVVLGFLALLCAWITMYVTLTALCFYVHGQRWQLILF